MENEIKYMSERFKGTFGFSLDLKNPKSFNEKIQWIKLHERTSLRKKVADKIEGKEFIIDKIGDKYVPELYYAGGAIDQSVIDELPSAFVIKAAHGCKMNLFVKDKVSFRLSDSERLIQTWLKIDYYNQGQEWCYKGLQKRILIEEFLGNKEVLPYDYKFFMLNNKLELIIVDIDRSQSYKRNFFTKEWENLRISYGKYPTADVVVQKPEKLNEMIEIATILSQDFSFIRVDFYNIDNRIFVGELTNYPANGFGVFNPTSFDYELGSKLEIKEELDEAII